MMGNFQRIVENKVLPNSIHRIRQGYQLQYANHYNFTEIGEGTKLLIYFCAAASGKLIWPRIENSTVQTLSWSENRK